MSQKDNDIEKEEKCTHKLKSEKLTYLGWHDWAEKMTKQGFKQKQCKKCKKWLFDFEI